MSYLNIGIDHDFRIPEYKFENGLNKLLNDPDCNIVFLSKERQRDVLKAEILEDFDIFISRGRIINRDSLQKASNLNWIGRFGVGFENIDIGACTSKGILVSNSPRGMYQSVAESILGFMVALNNKFMYLNKSIRRDGFKYKDKTLRKNLYEKTLGFIGFGGIAAKVQYLVKPLKMKILVYDPYYLKEEIENRNAQKVPLNILLEKSDFISINVPLTAETEGMLKEEHFKLMKNTAFFINTSRGGIYKDAILAKALKKGWIAGAGIDVFENEPHVENNPLLKIENAILTPHTAGARHSIDSLHKTEEIIVDSIINIKKGKWPFNILNPEAVKEEIPAKYLSPSYI